MPSPKIAFDHIHIISADPPAAAQWYVDILGGEIENSYELRGAPQIAVAFADTYLLIRGQRPGEAPSAKTDLQDFADYASHDQWGTDHFGFRINGDFDAYCEALRTKGANYLVEPHDFLPGSRIAYLAAPDGVTVELVQAKG
jgi:catechol 2,3-dioxygenase-like lactoylglutathione lyase family enzyme